MAATPAGPLTGGAFGRSLGLALILLSPFLLAFGPPGITESDAARAPLYPHQLRLMGEIQWPNLTAKAALIMDAATGKVVFERQGHMRMAPASLTKIMTAIVALEKGKPADRVTVRNIPLPQEASMGLMWGDVLTLEDLLWGLLLASGNDAATVISDYVGGGSVDNFVRMMNDKADQLGLKNTHFVNPHGLDEDEHYSTAYDLAVMARYAMGKPLFAQMVATHTQVVRASRTFYLQNSNYLLRPQNASIGADGIKTGYTDDAGDSIVASATRDGHRVIAVALGAADRTAEAIKLFNFAFDTYQWVELALPPYLTAWDATNGSPRPIVVKEQRHEYLPRWEVPRLVPLLRIDGGTGLQPGVPIGSVIYLNGDSPLAQIPLYTR